MTKKKKHKIAIIDAKTDPFGVLDNDADSFKKVYPFVWGLHVPEDGTYFEFWSDNLSQYGDQSCTDKLMEFLQDEEFRIYAHNGGKFDYLFLLSYFENELMLVNGRLAKAKFGANEFYDSWMILPVPLSHMEKDTEFDYSKMLPEKRGNYRNDISTYLKSDCINLGRWVTEFVNRFGYKFTLASTSFDQIKKSGRDIEKTTEFHDSRFRQFYYGGRTQCFKKGEFDGPLVYYDINSAYPYAMLHNHPIGKTYVTLSNPKTLPKGGAVYFAHIRAVSRGALPSRDPDTQKLIYYDDDIAREYWVTGWEIDAGLETNTLDVKQIYTVYKYVTTENFKKFILDLYEEKSNSVKGTPSYLFAKILMNAGYGKYGMDSRKFKEYKIVDYEEDPHTVEEKEQINELIKMIDQTVDEEQLEEYNEKLKRLMWKLHCDFDDKSIYERPNPGNDFYNVATAASITGFVRAYLWRHICASVDPIYCDTDSLICREFSGKIGCELGEWSLECDIEKAYIAQRKMYAVKVANSEEWKTASKGVKFSAAQIVEGVKTGKTVEFKKESPAISIKYGQRFLTKFIDFSLES